MIVILSQDANGIQALSRNQANVPVATFGSKQVLSLSLPVLGASENLFIVASEARRDKSFAPVLGDETASRYWDAPTVMALLEDSIPQTYGGSVYIAAAEVDHPLSCMQFAGTFKTVLLGSRRMSGTIYGQADATLGPIFAPGDRRWIEAEAVPVTATTTPVSRLTQIPASSMM